MSILVHLCGGVFRWVLQTSWQAAVLAGLIALAQFLLRRRLSASWRYGLWLLLVARLLMPTTPSSAFSVFNLARRVAAVQATNTAAPEAPVVLSPAVREAIPSAPSVQTAISVQSERYLPENPGPAIHGPDLSVSAAGAAPPPPAPRAPSHPSLKVNWLAVASFVWLAGLCFCAARLAWTNARFRSRLAACQPVADAGVLRLFDECRAAFGIRRPVRLVVSAETETPALYGLWRRWLLLPGGIFKRFSGAELRCIFLHELAHLKRGDLAVNWLVSLLQAVHWFNPILWLAWGRMRADRELATDACALALMRASERMSYGETILKVVEGLSGERPQRVLVGIAESKAHLRERLTLIARARRSWKWLALPVVLLIAGLGLTSAQTNSKPSPSSALTVSTRGVASPADSGEILAATAAGNLDEIRSLLKADPGLASGKDAYGQTPLHLAAGMSPLEKGGFVPTNCLAMAQLFLANKADVNARNNRGNTPLWLAADKGVAAVLLDHKADVDAKGEEGFAPLHEAAIAGDAVVAEVLLAHHATVDARNIRGDTPLGLAANKAVAQVLLDYKADINAKDNGGGTPLQFAAGIGRLDVVELLLASNADLSLKTGNGEALLHAAALPGNVPIAKLLLAHGVDVNARDNHGQTPLHIAAKSGHNNAPMTELLLANKADVDARDNLGETPLFIAVVCSHKETAASLLAHHADANAKAIGVEPYVSAFSREDFLWSAGDNPGGAEVTNAFRGATPLHVAASDGSKELVELLLAHNAGVNATNNAGQTPLHLAFLHGHLAVAELLLANKADPDVKDNLGASPMDVAARKFRQATADSLRPSGGETSPANAPATRGNFLQTTNPPAVSRVETNVTNALQQPVPRNVEELADINAYSLPMHNYVIAGGLPLQPDADWDAILAITSSSKFSGAFTDLGRMDKRAASAMLANQLTNAVSEYLLMYSNEMRMLVKYHQAADPGAGQMGLSFVIGIPDYHAFTNAVDSTNLTGNASNPVVNLTNTPGVTLINGHPVVILGARFRVLSLTWLAGLLELQDLKPQVRSVVELALKQRDELYAANTLDPNSREQMLSEASLYNRQILGYALLGVTEKSAARDAALDKSELVVEQNGRSGPFTAKHLSPSTDAAFDNLWRALAALP